jgi:hypothetical protein
MPSRSFHSPPKSGHGSAGVKLLFRLGLSTQNEHLTARSVVAVCNHFMNDILNKSIVLVLNRNWQAINVRTPQEAFCQMATNVATGLEIEGEIHIRPVTWEEWSGRSGSYCPSAMVTTPCKPCAARSVCQRSLWRSRFATTTWMKISAARASLSRPILRVTCTGAGAGEHKNGAEGYEPASASRQGCWLPSHGCS